MNILDKILKALTLRQKLLLMMMGGLFAGYFLSQWVFDVKEAYNCTQVCANVAIETSKMISGRI